MKVLVDGKPIQKFEMLALPKEMAEEVLILSDMYDLDELMSLELLNTGKYILKHVKRRAILSYALYRRLHSVSNYGTLAVYILKMLAKQF